MDSASDILLLSHTQPSHTVSIISIHISPIIYILVIVSKEDFVLVPTPPRLSHVLWTLNLQTSTSFGSRFVSQLTLFFLCFTSYFPNTTNFITFLNDLSSCREAATASHPQTEVLYFRDFNLHRRDSLDSSSSTDGWGSEPSRPPFLMIRSKSSTPLLTFHIVMITPPTLLVWLSPLILRVVAKTILPSVTLSDHTLVIFPANCGASVALTRLTY